MYDEDVKSSIALHGFDKRVVQISHAPKANPARGTNEKDKADLVHPRVEIVLELSEGVVHDYVFGGGRRSGGGRALGIIVATGAGAQQHNRHKQGVSHITHNIHRDVSNGVDIVVVPLSCTPTLCQFCLPDVELV